MRRVLPKPYRNNIDGNQTYHHENDGDNPPWNESLWIITSSSKKTQKQHCQSYLAVKGFWISSALVFILIVILYQNWERIHFLRLGTSATVHPMFDTTTNTVTTYHHATPIQSSRHVNDNNHDKKCDKFHGILHIQHGDREGAAGSIFFLFILNQLLYADQYQLLPWIHLNNISQYVYDDKVHNGGGTYSRQQSFPVWSGPQVSWSHYVDGPSGNKTFDYPGPPIYLSFDPTRWQLQNMSIVGNGVWESYFRQPLYHQDFSMPLVDCPQLPLLKMTFEQVIPSLHAFCPWSVRAWKYGGVPPSLQPTKNQTMKQWLEPQRIRAHDMITKYYHFQPALLQRVNDIWQKVVSPTTTPSTTTTAAASPWSNQYNCLGVHVRHSDKANLRKRIPTDRFKPYVDAYRKAGGTCVYLATDSHKVVARIRQRWPSRLSDMITTPSSVLRSDNKTAVFVLGQHHRTNTEVLVDILALSKCQFLLHGYSAVSEASIYIHLALHHQSVNLEDRIHPTVDEFESMVRRVLGKRQDSPASLRSAK